MSVAAHVVRISGPARSDEGRRVKAPFGRRRCEVTHNEAVGRYRLVGVADERGPAPLPGQFYMLASSDGWGEGKTDGASQRPYLARAFSICRRRGERLDFLVEEVGPGTRRLAALRPGEGIFIVGPLGVGFSTGVARREERALLVGGGAGLAPLVILAEALADEGTAASALLGFRSATYGAAARLFPAEVLIATDDGSLGHGGLVTELLERELERHHTRVYACGPPPMLEQVRRLCAERSVAAELAMEEAMACGFGACFGCVVRTKSGYRRICVDGPVVAAGELDERWLDA